MKRTDADQADCHEADDFCAHCQYQESVDSQVIRNHHAKTGREFRKDDKKRIMEEWGDPTKD
jgi:hypothetical protein